jgi:hypothetical protein
MQVPVTGPKHNGTIYLIAIKRAGIWKYSLLELEVGGQVERIDLLTDRPDLKLTETPPPQTQDF